MRSAFAMIYPVPFIRGDIHFQGNVVAVMLKALNQYLALLKLFVVCTRQPRLEWMADGFEYSLSLIVWDRSDRYLV